MDSKARSILSDLHESVLSMSFDEMTIFSLMVLLRDYQKSNQVIVGLADFIAHREKDRGDVHRYLEHTRNQMLSAQQGKGFKFTISVVYSELQILDALNSAFSAYSLTPISHQVGSGVVLCLISLFQNIDIYDRRTRKAFASMGLNVSECLKQNEFTLLGRFALPSKKVGGDFYVLVPILTTSYMPSVDTHLLAGPDLFKVVNNVGHLHLTPSC